VRLSEEDFMRGGAAAAVKEQRELRTGGQTLEEFLRRVRIRVVVESLTETNIARVEQLFQKTNQFNLTTKRYSTGDLRRLLNCGAEFGVFAYEDAFGPQGVIAAVIALREAEALRIDSWIMSCRVLNRTVEHAIFEWILRRARHLPILAEFRPTAKNALVGDLYARLGFARTLLDAETGCELWRFDAPSDGAPVPMHFVELRDGAN
jgi:FkbH-like protein